MGSAKIHPPPPPSYDQATGLGSAYNTQYSTPLRPIQPTAPPLQMGGANPAHTGPPIYVPPTTIVVAPSNPVYTVPPQMGRATFSTGPPPMIGTAGQMHPGLSHWQYARLKRQAITASICFFPLGIAAWFELKHTTDAYKRGSVPDAKRHESILSIYTFISFMLGSTILLLIFINSINSSEHNTP